jgi:hypothetical protein
MLLNKGVTLDAVKVESIQRYYQLDPPQRGVWALVHGSGKTLSQRRRGTEKGNKQSGGNPNKCF